MGAMPTNCDAPINSLPINNASGMGCFLGSVAVPNVTRIGPIAARMINLRRKGYAPKVALADAMLTLNAQGVDTVTPEIHMQLAAGMQPFPNQGLSGFLGSLGLAPIVSTGLTSGSVAGSAVGTAGAAALGIGGGIALGQTVIPIPVVGAVVGAVVFEAIHLMQRHVGKAEASWTSQSFLNALAQTAGREFEEHSFSEAFKGMMDTNNSAIPGCGADRHKNPDCLMSPLATVIAQGYLSGAVPLSAETAQVWQTVVLPWLRGGANGLVNWNVLQNGPHQLLMLQAATDRYLAGEAMTRADMPSYNGQGYTLHTPTLVQALASILQQPTTSTPTVTGVIPNAPMPTISTPSPDTAGPSAPLVNPIVTPILNPTTTGGGASYPPSGPYGGGGSMPTVTYTNPVPLPAALPQGGFVIPLWAILAGVAGLGFLLLKPDSAPAK
jgi:hypothetical protein